MFRRVFAGVEKALNTKNWEKTLERLDQSLRSAAIFSVLEQLGKLSLLFGVASALWTFDRQREEQVRTRQREAWQVILAAEGRRGSGGRHDALETLVRDDVTLWGVNVAGAYLDFINLTGARMTRAVLSGTRLQDGTLTDAIFDHADLRRADLRGAKMAGARFFMANLAEACLARVETGETRFPDGETSFMLSDLRGAGLNGANLSKAVFNQAQVAGASFDGARGLTCDQLRRAEGWDLAFRDEALKCGGSIPARRMLGSYWEPCPAD